jgi:hypothetical protein
LPHTSISGSYPRDKDYQAKSPEQHQQTSPIRERSRSGCIDRGCTFLTVRDAVAVRVIRDFTSADARVRFLGIVRTTVQAIGNAILIRVYVVIAIALAIRNAVIIAVIRVPTSTDPRFTFFGVIRTGIITIQNTIRILVVVRVAAAANSGITFFGVIRATIDTIRNPIRITVDIVIARIFAIRHAVIVCIVSLATPTDAWLELETIVRTCLHTRYYAITI